jgi:hypothetical protein
MPHPYSKNAAIRVCGMIQNLYDVQLARLSKESIESEVYLLEEASTVSHNFPLLSYTEPTSH